MIARTPYLIQRATINRPLADKDTRLSRAANLDYMGSAEFEFGALPKSFRRIEQNADAFVMRLVPEIQEGEAVLRVWSYLNDEDFAAYKQHLLAMRENKLRLKESSYFDANHNKNFKHLRADFWWDIDNDVMFGFDKNFMNRVGHYVAASIMYMNSKQETK